MLQLSQYTNDRKETLQSPVYDAGNDVFIINGTVSYTLTPSQMFRAQDDLKANIAATNCYDPTAVLSDLQSSLDEVTTAMNSIPAPAPAEPPIQINNLFNNNIA